MRAKCNFLKSLINACPYIWAGKKCLQTTTKQRTKKLHYSKELEYKSGMKLGRNISLVGLLCPFFWFSLFTGASKSILWINAFHSGIVIVMGLGVVLFNFLLILRYKEKTRE